MLRAFAIPTYVESVITTSVSQGKLRVVIEFIELPGRGILG